MGSPIDNVELGDERLPSIKEFGEGVFTFEIQAIKKLNSQNHGPGVLAEFKVLDSTNPAHTPGTRASYMLFEKYNQYNLYWKNLAAFIRGVTGSKPDGDDLASVLDESNPTAGGKVQVQIQKPGKYNKFSWIHVG